MLMINCFIGLISLITKLKDQMDFIDPLDLEVLIKSKKLKKKNFINFR